jgi:hypothetical protein
MAEKQEFLSKTRRMFFVDLTAVCAINSIANGASIVAACPVSRFER